MLGSPHKRIFSILEKYMTDYQPIENRPVEERPENN